MLFISFTFNRASMGEMEFTSILESKALTSSMRGICLEHAQLEVGLREFP
jgi:hypothetical protein